jgi:hypothetical protein
VPPLVTHSGMLVFSRPLSPFSDRPGVRMEYCHWPVGGLDSTPYPRLKARLDKGTMMDLRRRATSRAQGPAEALSLAICRLAFGLAGDINTHL